MVGNLRRWRHQWRNVSILKAITSLTTTSWPGNTTCSSSRTTPTTSCSLTRWGPDPCHPNGDTRAAVQVCAVVPTALGSHLPLHGHRWQDHQDRLLLQDPVLGVSECECECRLQRRHLLSSSAPPAWGSASWQGPSRWSTGWCCTSRPPPCTPAPSRRWDSAHLDTPFCHRISQIGSHHPQGQEVVCKKLCKKCSLAPVMKLK